MTAARVRGATWHLLYRAGDELGTRRLWRQVLDERDEQQLADFMEACAALAPLPTLDLEQIWAQRPPPAATPTAQVTQPTCRAPALALVELTSSRRGASRADRTRVPILAVVRGAG